MVHPPLIEAANVSMADWLILMVMALVVFGPRRLPQLGRQFGKLMFEFRKASNDFKFQMEEELRTAEEAERRTKAEEERQRQLAANPPAQIEAGTQAAAEEVEHPKGVYPYFGPDSEPAESTQLTIQPPSTGETVAAIQPGETVAANPHGPVAPPAETGPLPVAEEVSGQPEPAAQDTEKPIEPAAHNG
jgi:sec-independent protein translocase protein TatB